MIIEPGMEIRAFRLDGTSVMGKALLGPVRKPGGGMTDVPVVLEGLDEGFPDTLVEPAGVTLHLWDDRKLGYRPKVGWENLAYAILKDMLPGDEHWSGYMNEYVKVDWKNQTVKSELGRFHAGHGPPDESSWVLADTFLERLAPALWTFQEEETRRIKSAIDSALMLLGSLTAVSVSLPRWAEDFVEGATSLSLVRAPYPMVMTGPKERHFAPIVGIVPKPEGM